MLRFAFMCAIQTGNGFEISYSAGYGILPLRDGIRFRTSGITFTDVSRWPAPIFRLSGFGHISGPLPYYVVSLDSGPVSKYFFSFSNEI